MEIIADGVAGMAADPATKIEELAVARPTGITLAVSSIS